MITQGSRQYPVTEVIVHCSATRPEWMGDKPTREKVAEIRRWHVQDRGWRDIGYHWTIDRDGTVASGRPETQIGAGVLNHNRGIIHVCLIGGHGSDAKDRFHEHFTPAQDRALRDLIERIKQRAPIKKLTGHNQYAAKACPGFDVGAWWFS